MKTLLPLIISGFVLCGFFAVCLSAALLPRSEPDSEPVSEFDLFPPFQPVYINSNDFRFNISVPLDRTSYSFSWSYSQFGSKFKTVDSSDTLFSSISNSLRVRPSANIRSFYVSNCFYFKCDAFELGTANLLHTYYFSYQFFDFPVSSSVSSSARSVLLDPDSELESVTEDEPEPEPELETEDEPEPEPETEDEPEPEPETEDEPEPEPER